MCCTMKHEINYGWGNIGEIAFDSLSLKENCSISRRMRPDNRKRGREKGRENVIFFLWLASSSRSPGRDQIFFVSLIHWIFSCINKTARPRNVVQLFRFVPFTFLFFYARFIRQCRLSRGVFIDQRISRPHHAVVCAIRTNQRVEKSDIGFKIG